MWSYIQIWYWNATRCTNQNAGLCCGYSTIENTPKFSWRLNIRHRGHKYHHIALTASGELDDSLNKNWIMGISLMMNWYQVCTNMLGLKFWQSQKILRVKLLRMFQTPIHATKLPVCLSICIFHNYGNFMGHSYS